jgi:hypothetical protein
MKHKSPITIETRGKTTYTHYEHLGANELLGPKFFVQLKMIEKIGIRSAE